jgi:hypothetical protein
LLALFKSKASFATTIFFLVVDNGLPYPLFFVCREAKKNSEVSVMTKEKSVSVERKFNRLNRESCDCLQSHDRGDGDFTKFYLSEFSFDDGDCGVTFNIVGFTADLKEISVAVSREGRVSVQSFDLKSDENGRLFFEYGLYCDKIAVEDFEQVREEN